MYKQTQFEIKSLEEVKNDVQQARQLFRRAKSIFLGDSDNLVHKQLPEIVAFIRKTFPETKRITTYARAKTVLRHKMEFLVSVRKAGLDRLHIGLESGDKVVLERLRKGVTAKDMVEAGSKAKKAVFEVSFYVICGAGGTSRWKEHALNSARVLNRIKPEFVRLRTLTLQPGTPLKEKLIKGEFNLLSPLQRLKEVRLLLENLDLEHCYLASDHLTNYLWVGNSAFYKGVAGTLPHDKEEMLKVVQEAIEFIGSTNLKVKDSNQLYEEGLISSL